MKNIIKNVFLVMISTILILFLVELTLYLSGRVYYIYRIQNKIPSAKEKNTIRILCLGDSNTFGMGAEKGYSYPEQLEGLLNKNNPRKKFIVYNCGMPANTSSKLLSHLEEDLRKYEPHILIVLIGANDIGQIQETNYFLFKKGALSYRLKWHLRNIQLYKLFKRIYDQLAVTYWKNKLIAKYKGTFISDAKKLDAIRFLVDNDNRPEGYEKHIKAAGEHFNAYTRDPSFAIEELKKAKATMPNNVQSYLMLAQIYQACISADGNMGELAIDELEEAIRINPNSKDLYNTLWVVHYQNGHIELAQEALEKYLYLNPGAIATYLPFLKYSLPDDFTIFDKVIRYNIEKIIAIARQRNIEIILQNYPKPENFPIAVRELVLQYKIAFVDNGQVFKKIASNQDYKESDYFVPDTHCNNKGYSIMAENVYKAIKDVLDKE